MEHRPHLLGIQGGTDGGEPDYIREEYRDAVAALGVDLQEEDDDEEEEEEGS